MAATLWLDDGRVLTDSSGAPLLCDTCPCGVSPASACPQCSRTPTSVSVEFTADLNAAGQGCGYCGACTSHCTCPIVTISDSRLPIVADMAYTGIPGIWEWTGSVPSGDYSDSAIRITVYCDDGGTSIVVELIGGIHGGTYWTNTSAPVTNTDGCPTPGAYAPYRGDDVLNVVLSYAGSAVADCTSWISAFTLHQLSQAEVDNMVATWPTTWPQTEPIHRAAGCYYGLFSGLPCGATSMVFEIVCGGASSGTGTDGVTSCTPGAAVGMLTIGWADGTRVQITVTHAVTGSDCCTNFSFLNEGVSGATIGISATGDVPCDFAYVAVGQASDMILTAHCTSVTHDFNQTDFYAGDFA